MKGKAGRQRPLPLGGWRWAAAAILFIWLFLTVIVPLSGIALRAFVSTWGEGVKLSEVWTLDHFREVFQQEPVWLDILPRLVPSGLIDQAVMTKLINTYK